MAGNDPSKAAALRARLKGGVPLAYGVSGPLGAPLFSSAEVSRLVAAARHAGVRIFDTGPSYGAGEAERRLGAALRGDDDAAVMTKAGVEASGAIKRIRNFSPMAITRGVERSLTRLRRERIDLLWLHGPAEAELTDDLRAALEKLVDDGKVLATGLACRDFKLMNVAARAPFCAFMAPANRLVGPPGQSVSLLQSDTVFFGIECLAAVPTAARAGFTRSGLWKGLRSVLQRRPAAATQTTVTEAFDFAFREARCDIVVTTTTRAARLRENADACRRFAGE